MRITATVILLCAFLVAAEDCVLTLDKLKGKKGRSWRTDDKAKVTIETIAFAPFVRQGVLMFRGTESGNKKFSLATQGNKQRLVTTSNRRSYPYAILIPGGNLQWSNGITSQIYGANLCPEFPKRSWWVSDPVEKETRNDPVDK